MHGRTKVSDRTSGHAYCYRHHIATIPSLDSQKSTDATEEEDWDRSCVLLWAAVCYIFDCQEYHLWEEKA
jgi:hypothetical protein